MKPQLSFQLFSLVILCTITAALDPKCNQTTDEGTGEERTLVYFYNPQQDICMPLFHKGECSGGNCFKSDQECISTCSQKVKDLYPEGDAVCMLKMDPGNCFASNLQYYYDKEERVCRMFLYGGCHGNGNRFNTKEDCQSLCQAKSGRLFGAADTPNPDEQTVDAGLIVGILGGIIFAVAVIIAVALFVTQRKTKRAEMKKVPTTDIEMT